MYIYMCKEFVAIDTLDIRGKDESNPCCLPRVNPPTEGGGGRTYDNNVDADIY